MAVKVLVLERRTIQFCAELRNKHKKRVAFHDGRFKVLFDLPTCAVSCQWKRNDDIKSAFSKFVRSDTYDKVKELKIALLACVAPGGKIGDLTNLQTPKGVSRNQVGRCAEPHAAKECMLKYHRATLNEIYFSTALDITTGEPKEACVICKRVFPTIK